MAPPLGAKIRGVIVLVLLLGSSLFGATFVSGTLLPVFFMRPQLYRVLFDFFLGSWEAYVASLIELILGVKFVISGDTIRPNECNLILMNHRTRLDWMYFWSVLLRQSGAATEKIILKNPLKHVPGGGWAMQAGCFMFVKRRLEDDKKVLVKMMNYFSDLKYKTQLLLFPEGTDLSDMNRVKSEAFAKKNGLTSYEYVLHPRTAGFTLVTEHMRENSDLQAIYDVSIAYPYNIPQNETDLVFGNCPREVHFCVKRHLVSSLPADAAGISDWCKLLWMRKEQQLRQFYQDKTFTPGGATDPLPNEQKARMTLTITFICWTSFVICCFFLLIYSWVMRWYVCILSVFFLWMDYKGGFEIFQVDFFNKHFNSRKRD